MTKLEKCLMECYTTVYNTLGVDFNIVSEKENFFLDYEMDNQEQLNIINTVIKKYKLKPYEATLVKNGYWLGCSPKDK